MRRNLALLAVLLPGFLLAGPDKRELWVYAPANYLVPAEADRIEALLRRARPLGYTHFLVADSKFSRLGQMDGRYFDHVARVRRTAADLGIEVIPAVFPVGYSNDLLSQDPNLAEGLPVEDALFVVAGGVARHTPDPATGLPGTGLLDRRAWGFVDESVTLADGVACSARTDGNARLMQTVKLHPFRQYHVSVEIRTEGFAGGQPEIKVLADGERSLQWTSLRIEPTQDWVRKDVTFNSLGAGEARVYFGVWGGHRGKLWWRAPRLEECGLVNVLRRPGAPLRVRREGGGDLVEGRDFAPVADPELGTKPWPGEFTAWHQPPDLSVRNLPDGTRLRVSFFHPHIVYDGQVCACVAEPKTMGLLADQAKRVHDLWGSRTHLMSHDEWRVLGWDTSCITKKLAPGRIVADNARACADLLRGVVADGRICVWSDMFDPHHNAVDNYYLVNGSLAGAWEGLAGDLVVVNWNFGKREESLRFFSRRGHRQVIAGYYDGPLGQIRDWLDAARGVPGVVGVLYTTWRQDYSQLEAFARIVGEATATP